LYTLAFWVRYEQGKEELGQRRVYGNLTRLAILRQSDTPTISSDTVGFLQSYSPPANTNPSTASSKSAGASTKQPQPIDEPKSLALQAYHSETKQQFMCKKANDICPHVFRINSIASNIRMFISGGQKSKKY